MKTKQGNRQIEPPHRDASSRMLYHERDRIWGRAGDDTLLGGTRCGTPGYWHADDLPDACPAHDPATQSQSAEIPGHGDITPGADSIEWMPRKGAPKERFLSRLVGEGILPRILTGEALSGVEFHGVVGREEEYHSPARDTRDDRSLLAKDGAQQTNHSQAELWEMINAVRGAECPPTESFDIHFCRLCGLRDERVRVSISSQVATSPRTVLVTERGPVPQDRGLSDLGEVLDERDPIAGGSPVDHGVLSAAPAVAALTGCALGCSPAPEVSSPPRGAVTTRKTMAFRHFKEQAVGSHVPAGITHKKGGSTLSLWKYGPWTIDLTLPAETGKKGPLSLWERVRVRVFLFSPLPVGEGQGEGFPLLTSPCGRGLG